VIDEIINKPGCMSSAQTKSLADALSAAEANPSLLSDLEGCGPVAELEEKFAEVCGVPFALAVSSGTAALHAALLAAGVGPGDEVIVTPYSWPQSVAPVVCTGAMPVFADIDPKTLNIDPEKVARLVSEKTRAIIPVHLFGNPADMARLQTIAKDAGALLIADAAHALGASLEERPVGTWGDAACFSLGRGKLVCGGEGGVLVTRSVKLYESALALTQHPERVRRRLGPRFPIHFGLNYRIHPLAAVLALAELKQMNVRLDHRRRVRIQVLEALGDCKEVQVPPSAADATTAAYGVHLCTEGSLSRDTLVASARAEGLALRCGPVREPLHLTLAGQYRRFVSSTSKTESACPAAEEVCRSRELWLLSALDMDAITAGEAGEMGCRLRRLIESLTLGHHKPFRRPNEKLRRIYV
jgi:dTDP-4-amino-4,6-dideoxygalactose transaminase